MGRISCAALTEHQLGIARAGLSDGSFLRLFEGAALAQARAVDTLIDATLPVPRLAGLGVAIKDLFDVAGHPATGGSLLLSGQMSVLQQAPASQTRDAVSVARLRAAGATLIGHTGLSEFAFSGLGLNPHHGTPANPVTACLEPEARIPGGSTSGGAVALARGACWAALGSDTGGSIRIPAALNGLVGFKNTQRLTPLVGSIPLAPSLDTACALTLSVRDAIELHEILADRMVARTTQGLEGRRLAVPRGLLLEQLDPTVARSFSTSLTRLSAAGAKLVEVDMPALSQLPTLQAHGGLPAIESWAWHRHRLAEAEAAYDPRVALRIRRGASASAADYLDLLAARIAWQRQMQDSLRGYDAALCPTVPCVAPLLAPLVEDDDRFFQTNALMLRNPAVVNLLDGCALSLPCQDPGDWPVGLMIWQGAGQDDAVLNLGLAIEATLRSAHGA